MLRIFITNAVIKTKDGTENVVFFSKVMIRNKVQARARIQRKGYWEFDIISLNSKEYVGE